MENKQLPTLQNATEVISTGSLSSPTLLQDYPPFEHNNYGPVELETSKKSYPASDTFPYVSSSYSFNNPTLHEFILDVQRIKFLISSTFPNLTFKALAFNIRKALNLLKEIVKILKENETKGLIK